MKISIWNLILCFCLFLMGAAPSACGQDKLKKSLEQAITFYASFDEAAMADLAKGDKSIFTAPAYADLENAIEGNQIATVQLGTKGRFGSALSFAKKTKEVLFYRAEDNVEYGVDKFEGTVSLWLSLDPENDLEPGFCDPIQITDEGYNDGALWVDFSDKNPRSFRMGVFGDLAIWNPENIGPDKNPAFNNRLVAAQDRPFGSDRWTHVVIAFENINQSSGRAAFYVNGKFQGDRIISEPFTWSVEEAKIFLGLNYIGLLDEVAIFSKMLNTEEINLIYHSDQKMGDLLDID